VEIGLALPQYDFTHPFGRRLPWSEVVAWAERAEALGFGSLWLADHLFLGVEKYGGPAGEFFGFDPIVALGALARRTSRVRLGTLVLCSQLRPPKLLVRQLQTLQDVAGGRLIPGLGAGWYEPEYRRAGIPFERPVVRLRQLADALDLVAGAGLPHWAGGRGDRFLDVVAGHADGWNSVWSWTPAAYAERLAVLEAACERRERDPEEITRSLGLFALVGEDEGDLRRRFERLRERTAPGVLAGTTLDEWRTGRLVGTVEEVRAQVSAWRDLGVAMLIVGPGALPFSTSDPDDLDLVASALS